jgi:hypothetical protein
MDRFPIERYTVPAQRPFDATGFTVVDQAMTAGLPHVVPINPQLSLVISLPSGLAATWRDADPSAVVSHSDLETAPQPATGALPVEYAQRPPLRAYLRISGSTIDVVPFVAGARVALPDGVAPPGAQFELHLLSWNICAGTVRGPGDFGSRISVAWRRADRAVMQYSTPPANTYVLRRLPFWQPPIKIIESWVAVPITVHSLTDSLAIRRGAIDVVSAIS